mmetsp:Transcript_28388/g.83503  ORF Transcript_28388/g.83503 Transcript_28388/m.83503 type:complete len:263 (-) Transcript_28388:172-960(-)|eukprot:CAMPEP_0113532732 /NCGR_PEP_ID=MMETSP0015_2-20120614/4219_1 /TAXON_ID=2838 /ORGANISM="Odontella" /LENGTH=262 /DNA_ID=CAMNT_0000431719 /DNA_START=91 /DNA_END=879 /DNA_ORIENTATION=+ /assembly_acc=CAM_ASM_000160
MSSDSSSRANETKWIDAWVRWERTSYDSDDGDDNDQDSTAVAPTETYSFHYSTKREESIDIELRGFHSDSEQIWNSTGLTLWRSSHHLCEYLVEHQDLLGSNKRILELGSGLGRCGILAHKLSLSSEVLLTDGDTDTLAQLRENVDRNVKSEENVSCHQLLWGRETSEMFLKQHGEREFDLLIGSDLVYVTGVIAVLWESVQVLLSKKGGIFLMAHCARREGNDVTVNSILEAAENAGFDHELLNEEKDISLFEFRWSNWAD